MQARQYLTGRLSKQTSISNNIAALGVTRGGADSFLMKQRMNFLNVNYFQWITPVLQTGVDNFRQVWSF